MSLVLLSGVATPWQPQTGIVSSPYLRTRTANLYSVGSSADDFDIMNLDNWIHDFESGTLCVFDPTLLVLTRTYVTEDRPNLQTDIV